MKKEEYKKEEIVFNNTIIDDNIVVIYPFIRFFVVVMPNGKLDNHDEIRQKYDRLGIPIPKSEMPPNEIDIKDCEEECHFIDRNDISRVIPFSNEYTVIRFKDGEYDTVRASLGDVLNAIIEYDQIDFELKYGYQEEDTESDNDRL